ncbi:MAG: hypothetical protein K8S23_04665 [Candidatus Cloacimonetes bacterium]|nr:hypothetical protein [Candidatus Cloacimonadota bacterium]
MNIDKLYEFGKIWGEIKYFNPYIHINNVDWNKAYSDCYTKIKNCNKIDFLNVINDELLSKLNDPLARIEFSKSKEVDCYSENYFKMSSDSIIILKLTDWANNNVDSLIRKAIENRQNAKGLVLDLRNLVEEGEKRIYSKLDENQLLRYFSSVGQKRTSNLKMEYEGFPNERTPENVTFYKSYFKIQNKFKIPVFAKSVEVPIIIISGKGDPLSANILDLRNNNKCKVISIKDTFTNISDPDNASINTKFGKIAYSIQIPIFENSKKPVYSDFIIEKIPDDKIIEFALKEIVNYSKPSPQTESVDISSAIKMDIDFNENTFPSEIERVMAVTKLYIVINYFYPHKKAMNCNWDDIYKIFIKKAISCVNRNDYINLIKEMSAFTEDSHVFLWYTRENAIRKIPLTAIYLEKKMIISEIINEEFQTLHNVEIGDEIIEINGKSIGKLIEEQKIYISASREITLLRELIRILLIDEINKPFSLKLLSKTGLNKTVSGKYGEFIISDNYKKKSEESIKELTDYILYVKLYTLSADDIPELERKLTKFKNVIFDMRGYPSYYEIVTLLKKICKNDYFDWGKDKIPIISYNPATEDDNFFAFKTLISKSKAFPKFNNKIAVLINDETQSYAEAISDALRVNSEAILIGSNTAGANGDITFMSLPGNLDLMFSQMDALIADGTSMHKVGLFPDIEVYPTIGGISAGRDELIEKAIEYFNK